MSTTHMQAAAGIGLGLGAPHLFSSVVYSSSGKQSGLSVSTDSSRSLGWLDLAPGAAPTTQLGTLVHHCAGQLGIADLWPADGKATS